MLPHEVDSKSGARMVGGEIPDWTDTTAPQLQGLTGIVDAFAAGVLARVGEGAEILVAGFPSATLPLRSVSGAHTTLLVRGVPDARALAASGATVICGALDRLHDAGDRYDLVVAVGGPEATLSPDSPTLDAMGWVALVDGLLRPGGAAIVTVANPSGMDTLLTGGREPGPTDQARLDSSGPGPLATNGVPAVPGSSLLAAYPSVTDPTVLLGAREAAHATGTAQLAVRALAAHVTDPADVPTSLDPWTTAERLFRAGVGTPLAPGWLIALGHDLPRPPGLPDRSRLLESVLRDAVASGSHTAARGTVRSYAAWLASRADAPDLRDVLVLDDGSLEMLPQPWGPADSTEMPDAMGHADSTRDALARSLGDFAERACAAGIVALCPAPTPALVLRELLAMAGRDVPADATTDAATGLTVVSTESTSAATEPAPSSWAAARRRLAAAESALAEARRQVAWLEGTIRAKDRRIRTLERAIAIEASPAYKAVHQLGRPVPALKRRVRAYLDGRADSPR